MFSLTQTVAPAVEPVTLAEAKLHLRETASGQDALITSIIVAARERLETEASRFFIERTVRMDLPHFPRSRGAIQLPGGRASSITSFGYTNKAGSAVVVPPADYHLVGEHEPPIVQLADESRDWPDNSGGVIERLDAVQIVYVAGYGAAESDVPECVHQAMLLVIGHYYEHREEVVVGTISSKLPLAVGALLSSVKIPRVIPFGV